MKGSQYSATCIVHWPTGPVMACLEHARQLVAVGKALGTYVYSEETDEVGECKNCKNKSKGGHEDADRS